MRYRESAIARYETRRNPLSISKVTFASRPWSMEIRRPSFIDLRHVILRVKKCLPLSNDAGLEDMLRGGGEVPTEGTSVLVVATQNCG